MASSQQDAAAAQILERIPDAVFALNRDWQFTFLNSEAEKLWGQPREGILGKNVWQQFPEAADSTLGQQLRRAMDEQTPIAFEEFYPPLQAWLDVRLYPSPEGLFVFFRNATERRRAEAERKKHEEMLRQSEERYRLLVNGAKEYAMILMDPQARITGWNAGAERILGWTEAEVLGQAADLIFTPEDCALGVPEKELGRASAEGKAMDLRWHLKKDGARFYADGVMEGLHAEDGRLRGFAKILRDATPRKLAEDDQRRIEAELQEAHQQTEGILESITDAFMAFDSDWRFTYVNDQSERVMFRKREDLLGRVFWDEFPAALGSTFEREYRRAVREQVSVTFEEFYPPLNIWVEVRAYPSSGGLSVFYQDVTARKQSQQERERLAQSNRLLLDSTSDGIYGIDQGGRFTFVNRAAAQMLGYSPEEMLGRSGHALIHRSHSDGTPYPEVDCPIYLSMQNGQSIQVDSDAFWRKDSTQFPVVYSAAPILEEGAVRGAVITFSDATERKALEKERERLADRERNIASQLQAALTPSVPERIPGMALAKYYEAALSEARVGGDFYDVFPVDKGCTALVVGDLSGKGLAAASQVATVRNMLRYALYRARTLAGGVESLNSLLAEQGLLTGFATLFVGAFDSATGTLTYVNAGQEPGLVRRAATGEVEMLPPTGPILGSIEGVSFKERMVTLETGDALALFTDGLTEVGPTRREMLNIEGVINLLTETVLPSEDASAAVTSEYLVLRLIEGVDAAAGNGVMRDDVCLLVGVVEGIP